MESQMLNLSMLESRFRELEGSEIDLISGGNQTYGDIVVTASSGGSWSSWNTFNFASSYLSGLSGLASYGVSLGSIPVVTPPAVTPAQDPHAAADTNGDGTVSQTEANVYNAAHPLGANIGADIIVTAGATISEIRQANAIAAGDRYLFNIFGAAATVYIGETAVALLGARAALYGGATGAAALAPGAQAASDAIDNTMFNIALIRVQQHIPAERFYPNPAGGIYVPF
jgi:hypothetical protein